MLNFHSTSDITPKAQDTGGLIKLYCMILHYVLKIKECITETVQDNPNTEDDLLFDIMKCNFRHTSMQYMGEKRCKDKKLIEDIEGHIAQLQYQLTNNPPDEIIPQITKLTSELNSIYDTKVKQKMLDNRTAFYEDYEKNNKFFLWSGQTTLH